MNGLVLFDYDGTLVDEREDILTPTPKTKEAVTRLQENGYLCVLATGRAQSYIPKGAKNLYLDGYITSNGACVSVHGKQLFHEVFEDDELHRLLQDFKEFDINFMLENSQRCYVGDMEDINYHHFLDYFHVPKEKFVPYQDFSQVQGEIEKVTLIFPNRERLHAFANRIKGVYQVSFHRNCDTFDIAKKHIHKGVGVKAILEHYHIPLANTYAFGDGDNDVGLFRSVNCGIAMRIHDEQLDSLAKMVTGSVKEEGIYKALRKLEVI